MATGFIVSGDSGASLKTCAVGFVNKYVAVVGREDGQFACAHLALCSSYWTKLLHTYPVASTMVTTLG